MHKHGLRLPCPKHIQPTRRTTSSALQPKQQAVPAQEAFATLAGHPLPQQRGDLLGTLIPALFAARAIPVLLRLPFCGFAVVHREHGYAVDWVLVVAKFSQRRV